MRFSLPAAITSLIALASLSSARIYGFVGPSEPISKGVPFDVTFKEEGYIQNNQQFYALFGLTDRKDIGKTIGSAPVAGVDISSYTKYAARNFTVSITVDQINSDASEQTLATAVFGEVGASGGITVQYFNATVKVNPPSSSTRK